MDELDDMLEAARNIRDGENEWRQFDLACWVAENAEAMEVGLRVMAMPESVKEKPIGWGANGMISTMPCLGYYRTGDHWCLEETWTTGKQYAEHWADTPLEALRALDGGADE